MTDFKPFSTEASEPEWDRSVAVVLFLDAVTSHVALLRRAVRCLEEVHEACAKVLWLADPSLLNLLGADLSPDILVVSHPLSRVLSGELTPYVPGSHLLMISPWYPFLRAETLDEAIRLLKLRPDLNCMVSSVRRQGRVFSKNGTQTRESEDDFLCEVDTFTLVPRSHFGAGASLPGCFGFEISESESFCGVSPVVEQLMTFLTAPSPLA